jgi:hypothetical protein
MTSHNDRYRDVRRASQATKPRPRRVTIEAEAELVEAFDRWAAGKGLPSRGEAIRSLMTSCTSGTEASL